MPVGRRPQPRIRIGLMSVRLLCGRRARGRHVMPSGRRLWLSALRPAHCGLVPCKQEPHTAADAKLNTNSPRRSNTSRMRGIDFHNLDADGEYLPTRRRVRQGGERFQRHVVGMPIWVAPGRQEQESALRQLAAKRRLSTKHANAMTRTRLSEFPRPLRARLCQLDPFLHGGPRHDFGAVSCARIAVELDVIG